VRLDLPSESRKPEALEGLTREIIVTWRQIFSQKYGIVRTMPVELLINGTWELLSNTSVVQLDLTAYEVTIIGLNVLARISRIEDTSIRVGGMRSSHVSAGLRYNNSLVFRVQVQVDDPGDGLAQSASKVLS
jgi:hypothetical protein